MIQNSINQNENVIRIMDITYSSAVDGTGFRDVLFVNFCPHHCKGCQNEQTWSFENGKDVSVDEVYENLTKSFLTNVTFSGGEPFCQPKPLIKLARMLKKANKTIWIYTGFLFEEILHDEEKKELLALCDVCVDGKFEEDKKGLNMRFKGSSNQRIIDVKKSLDTGCVVDFDLSF